MSKAEKLLLKLKAAKNNFKWVDLVALLNSLDFQQIEGDGSRVTFVNQNVMIKLHKPHPQKELKSYALRQVKEILKREGIL